MPVWLSIITTATSSIVSVITLYLKIRSDMKAAEGARRETLSKELSSINSSLRAISDSLSSRITAAERSIDALNARHDHDIQGLRLETERLCQEMYVKGEEKRTESVKDFQAKIDEMEATYGKDTIERISKLEGTVTAKLDTIESSLWIVQSYIMDRRKM